jgi:hypothetical protein
MNAEHRSILCHAPRLALAFLALGSCGEGENGKPDAAPPASNPSVLWLNDINGSEGNLRLVGQGPPSPF